MPAKFVSVNGQLLEKDRASILVSDLAIQRGYGIFDFLKTIDGKPIFLKDHLDRFFHSAMQMGLDGGLDRTDITRQVEALMAANQIADSGLKIILTGGYSQDGYSPAKPNLIINQSPFSVSSSNFEKGTRLMTFNHQRQLPEIKTIDYLQAIRLQRSVAESGSDDVLYHHNSQICECPRANLFIVGENTIRTPKSNILAGITRKKILNFRVDGYQVMAEDFNLEDLYTAKEAFVSSSTKNILPVLEIDGKQIGTGKPGMVTSIVHSQLLAAIDNEITDGSRFVQST